MGSENKAKTELSRLFRARIPYIYISTWEEGRVCRLIREIAEDEKSIHVPRKVYAWSLTGGFICSDPSESRPRIQQPEAALDFIAQCDENSLFILKDFHIYMKEPKQSKDYSVIRKMRDIEPMLTESVARKNVIIVAPVVSIPLELQKIITVYDFPLPDIDDIEKSLDELLQCNDMTVSPDLRQEISSAALGLTLEEANNAFALSLIDNPNGLNEKSIQRVFEEKNQVIKKNGILEFIESSLTADDIGGLENLKKWLIKRRGSWLDLGKEYNLPAPKGVLITGVPGCGKSLTAKAMSTIWQLPLLKLDMGRIYSGVVGSSEQNMRRALETAEAVSPSILWIDEIEKGLAGNGSKSDGGTSTRVLGTFLTWMQEKTAPVFVIATSNDISGLPPELLRKGRFDEIFFVDLPTKNERMDIFRIHLNKRVTGTRIGNDIQITDDLLAHLADLSDGFVGAEIEQAVISALYEAFFDRRSLRVEDLEIAIKETVPLSVTQSEAIRRLREWASVRAVSASAAEDLENYRTAAVQETLPTPEADINGSRGGRRLDFTS